MRSSGSTHNPRRDLPARLYVVLAGEDHPKLCTGRRLLHRGLAREVARVEGIVPSPVVLDPYAADPLGAADGRSVDRGGILVVDCSWNRLTERGRFPVGALGESRRGIRRRLPILVATNPQHYGRLAQLNTVEALAASLYLVGRPEEAAHLLEGFRGSETFLVVNRERLEAYARESDADGVRAAERRLFGGVPDGG
jgi:pre-rRNA-processing protein TSR3